MLQSLLPKLPLDNRGSASWVFTYSKPWAQTRITDLSVFTGAVTKGLSYYIHTYIQDTLIHMKSLVSAPVSVLSSIKTEVIRGIPVPSHSNRVLES